MDKDATDNACGSIYTMKPGDDIRIKSTGQAPDGYCGITVFTPDEYNNYTCDALCITFKTASISVCDAKIKFVGHSFGKGGDMVKVIKVYLRLIFYRTFIATVFVHEVLSVSY